MRSKRTDRRDLKRTVARLAEENAALRLQLSSAPAPAAVSADQSARQDSPPAPAIASRGYPTRAAPLQAKTLKEAKEILMNSGDW